MRAARSAPALGALVAVALVACGARATRDVTLVPPRCAPAPDTSARARLRVVHEDKVDAMRLVGATYDLDGQRVHARGGGGASIRDHATETVVDADVAVGCHTVDVDLAYFTRTPTPYGYDLVYHLRSRRVIDVGAGGAWTELVSVDGLGTITTPLEQRFAVLWR